MMNLSIDKIILVIAIITGFATMRKHDILYLKLLPFFLLLTLTIEMIGFISGLKNRSNVIFYNFFTIIFFCFYTYFFSAVTDNPALKKRLHVVILLIPVLLLVNMLFLQGMNSYSLLAGSLLLIVLGVNYFYHLLSGPAKINLLNTPAFWISLGLTFYFVATFTIHGLVNFISSFSPETRRLLQKILHSTNAFFYILLTISFLCRINKRKSL